MVYCSFVNKLKFETLKINELISPNILLCFFILLIPYLRFLLWRTEKWKKKISIRSATAATSNRIDHKRNERSEWSDTTKTQKSTHTEEQTKQIPTAKTQKMNSYRRTNEKLTHIGEQTEMTGHRTTYDKLTDTKDI